MNEEATAKLAMAKSDPRERAAFLDQVCAGRPDLRAAVEALLATQGASASPPNERGPDAPEATRTLPPEGGDAAGPRPVPTEAYAPPWEEAGDTAPQLPRTPDPRPATAPGTVIAGRYTLIEAIGTGGMGSVYLAEQTDPVKRPVALKLIKGGGDSKAMLARFDAERQALALMDHPNIARVYDGGTTSTGEPFFVMELVRGTPITRFCDEHRLTVRARLELFVSTCQAVQHAHQKGIIHRDLKPGNVLVAEVDGRPTPKVIDFGLAKATGQRLTEESFADVGVIVGTPAYMSPEQADPSSLDIDTRTDVYALGVILYELLAGSPPLETTGRKREAILEVMRTIREVEPPRPSARLCASENLDRIAANRGVEPAKLVRLLRGELDWVVLKALEKERARRYETASAFARDLQRYLADEVVEARPPSARYRLTKFLRRNKGPVLATVALILLLLAGVVVSTRQARRAERAEGLASARLDQVQEALTESETSRREAEEVSHFLIDVFRGSNPWGRTGELTLEEVLEEARAKLPQAIQDNPSRKAELLDALGQTHTHAGLHDGGVEFLKEAHALRADQFGEDDPRTIRSLGHLALAVFLQGDIEEAIRLSSLSLDRARHQWRRDDPASPIPEFLGDLALMYSSKGEPEKSVSLCQEALERSREAKGPEHPDTAVAMWHLARAYNNVGNPREALPLAKASAEILARQLDDSHPQCIAASNFHAMALGMTTGWTEAVPLLEELYERIKKRFGATSPRTLEYAITELSRGYLGTKQDDKLLALLEPAVEQYALRRGPGHFVTLHGSALLAIAHARTGDYPKALSLCHDTLTRAEEKYGTKPRMMALIGDLLIRGLPIEGGEALEFSRKNLLQVEKLLGSEHPITYLATMNLANAYTLTDRDAEAETALRQAVERGRRHLPDNHPWRETALTWLATNQIRQRKHAGAASALRELLTLREKARPDSWMTFHTKSQLGGALLGQKKYADAEPLLIAGYEGLNKHRGQIPPRERGRLIEALERLHQVHEATGNKQEADKWWKELQKTKKEQENP